MMPNYAELTDAELGTLYSHADPLAAAELWRRHAPWLRKQAYAYSRRDPHIAERALADLQLCNADTNFQRKFQPGPDANWHAWMHTALRRTIRRGLFLNLPEWFGLSGHQSWQKLRKLGVPEPLLPRLEPLVGERFWTADAFLNRVSGLWPADDFERWQAALLDVARHVRRTAGSGADPDAEPVEPFLTSREPAPDDEAARNELLPKFRQHLKHCARQLEPRIRRLLHSRYIHSTAWARLAQELFHSNDHNVAFRAHEKALKALRQCLQQQFGEQYHDQT
ncbi:MAG: hypothetical protein JSS02_30240 [Planctomycetes bacterium]|nr:hypothetical protein [Planctomycetota bacterium]